jgi:hypothetical protein
VQESIGRKFVISSIELEVEVQIRAERFSSVFQWQKMNYPEGQDVPAHLPTHYGGYHQRT